MMGALIQAVFDSLSGALAIEIGRARRLLKLEKRTGTSGWIIVNESRQVDEQPSGNLGKKPKSPKTK